MSLTPSLASPVERVAPATNPGAEVSASLPLPPIYYPFEGGVDASVWPYNLFPFA